MLIRVRKHASLEQLWILEKDMDIAVVHARLQDTEWHVDLFSFWSVCWQIDTVVSRLKQKHCGWPLECLSKSCWLIVLPISMETQTHKFQQPQNTLLQLQLHHLLVWALAANLDTTELGGARSQDLTLDFGTTLVEHHLWCRYMESQSEWHWSPP